jgi:hypothetical protein
MTLDSFWLPGLVVVLGLYYFATSESRRNFALALTSLRLGYTKKLLLFFVHTVLFGLLLSICFIFLALGVAGVPRYFYMLPYIALLLSGGVHFYYLHRASVEDHT